MESPTEDKKSITPVQNVSLVLAHIVAVITFILVVYWANNYLGGLGWDIGRVFNWHPVLMVTGLIFCLVEAALAYRTFAFGKRKNKLIHLTWQTIGVICVSLGLKAVFHYHNKSVPPLPNLTSVHTWLGIAVVTLYYTQYVLGFVTFFYPRPEEGVRRAVHPYHVFIGIFLLFMAAATAEAGLLEAMSFFTDPNKCAYNITEPDTNPSSHYKLLPMACRLGNWLGISIFMTIFFTSFALLDLRQFINLKGSQRPRSEYNEVP